MILFRWLEREDYYESYYNFVNSDGVFLIICGGLLFSSFIKRPAGVAVLILGFVLILLAAYNYYKVTSRNSLETEAKSNYKAGASLYIDGKRQKDWIDMNGLNFDKYDIRIEKDKVYLISK